MAHPETAVKVGFFLVEEGNQIQGVLRDSFIVHGKFGDKRVYKIEVDAVGTRAVRLIRMRRAVSMNPRMRKEEKIYLYLQLSIFNTD